MVFRGNGGGISGHRQRIKRELWKTDCRFTANKGGGKGEGREEGVIRLLESLMQGSGKKLS